jgi:hypothetical protein
MLQKHFRKQEVPPERLPFLSSRWPWKWISWVLYASRFLLSRNLIKRMIVIWMNPADPIDQLFRSPDLFSAVSSVITLYNMQIGYICN